ncbi:MAG TPA: response regulator transcription factor [Gemmataceae bacterium]|jgi:DNA-binding NarL/FixJ family response regulator|nr:response regulator transcription factor [Gemmataceae bacterium]
MTWTLLLADDHQMVRQGLRALLARETDLRLVGEAAEGLEAVRLAERLRPDVLVLDLMMPGLNGLDVARQVARRAPETRVVILSMHAHEAYVLEALLAGAAGYVLKESSSDELVKAIRAVTAGQHYLSPPLSEEALGVYSRKTGSLPPDPYHTLTAREREVLQLTAEGHSGADIAERLYISPRTVETHRANLMRKLKVRNQKELIRYALQRGPQAPVPVLTRSPA